ncbi:hypothetical protein P4O66_013585, partial [Electrophorus voltai]
YGLALHYDHVCPLSNWEYRNSCLPNETGICCTHENVPTISTSGSYFPENSLFSATINAGSFLCKKIPVTLYPSFFFVVLVFCIFHHAHVLDRSSMHSLLSKFAVVFGSVTAIGAFVAANCNPTELELLHNLGAALSFVCVCIYTALLTSLTSRCALTGLEHFLYPLRIISSSIQVIMTILYCIFFVQKEDYYKHISAIFEWTLTMNLELFELSFALEFYSFSSSMLSVLLAVRDEDKPLILS